MFKTIPMGFLAVIVLVVGSMFAMLVYLICVVHDGIDSSFWFIPMACLLPMLLLAIVSFGNKVFRILGKVIGRNTS